MLDPLHRLLDKTGLNRVTIDTPVSQTQRTANRADTGVRPGPKRRNSHPSSQSAPMAPRQDVQRAATAVGTSPTASPLSALSPSPARSETALVTLPLDSAHAAVETTNPLVEAMRQGQASLPALVEDQFGPFSQRLMAKAALRHVVQSLMPALSPVAPVGLPGMPAVLLTQTLAIATGGDASRAAAALGALREMDPIADIAAARRPSEGGAAPIEPEQADAWRVAMELSATPSGLQLLQAVLARPVPAARQKDFALLLKTAAQMTARHPGLDATPAALLAAESPPTTLLAKALACASARLVGEVEAAQPHAWALNAVRNDLFDTGPGSDFAAADARLMKMGRWIDRATADRPLALRNPMIGKSAFRALRHSAQQVDRGPAVGRHRKAFDASLRRAATQLRDQLVQMAPFARAGGAARVPTELLRAAVLDHCVAAPASSLLDGKTFDDAALGDIAGRLATLVTQGDENLAQELAPQLRQLPELQAFAKAPMSMERLDEWLADAMASHAALPATAGTESSWAEGVEAELKTARLEVKGHDTRLPHVTREGMRDALKHIVRNLEGSSRLRLTSGGIVGAGLRQLSATVTGLATAFLLRGKLDARKQWGRQAVFEIAMPPYDMEIMVATQHQSAKQFGFGVFAGADLGLVKAGVNSDVVAYGDESTSLQGVTLRLPRIGRPVSELREEFSRLVDRLIDGTTSQARGETGEPLLQRLLQEFPELTVNRVGQAGDKRKRHGATLEGQASIQAPGIARGTVSVGAAVEAQRGVIRHYEDAAGSMRVERHIEAWNVRGGLGARLTVGSAGVAAGPVNLNAGNTDTTVLGISADLVVAGSSERREVVYQDGRLHPISFKETEHLNLGNFLAQMDGQRDDWVRARLASPDTTRTAEAEHAKLQQFMDEVSSQATPTHSYAVRSTIRPEAAARVDAFRSSALLAERQAALGVHPSATEVATAMVDAAEAEWKRPESMQPYSLRAYERLTTQETKGINLVAQFGALHIADASHIDHRLDAA